MEKKRLPRAKVVGKRDVTGDLFVLRLEPEVEFPFRPGQYCTLGIDGIERAYSLASAPPEPFLELFIEVVPGGRLTPLLHRLKPGDTVSLRPRAKGVFAMDPEGPGHLMIATVTGIAPFVSMIRDHFHRGGSGHSFYVLHGASYQDEFGYREEMEGLARRHAEVFHYVPTISRPGEARNSGWKGATGRVNRIVEEQVREFGLDPRTTRVYACGHPEMIEDVSRRLAPRGFQVKEEKYWV